MESQAEENTREVQISSNEYRALIDIRGLQEQAYWMVMTAEHRPRGRYALKGNPQAFEHLANDLAEEVEFDLSSQSNLRHLARLYHRLRPDDWI